MGMEGTTNPGFQSILVHTVPTKAVTGRYPGMIRRIDTTPFVHIVAWKMGAELGIGGGQVDS